MTDDASPHQCDWSTVEGEDGLPIKMVCSGCSATITPDTESPL